MKRLIIDEDNTMKDIVVIDIEATGVDLDTNEIIGISAVLLQSRKVTGLKYETWCNAPQHFDKEALKIIGKNSDSSKISHRFSML